MVSSIEAMFRRMYGSRWVEDVQRTPLCELRERLSPADRAYGGIHPSDRGVLPTSDSINKGLDGAIGYRPRRH